ncbi:MAG: amino acid permease [Cyanobacteriota bacterium]
MNEEHRKLGTFDGVFTPSILTLIGVILYLRLGWVVGNVGLFGALIIICLAHIATISTGLAMASMATNVKIGTGGFYSLLSRSLGLEIGGAIGIPLYLSQALSTALYIVGFTEAILSYYPDLNPHLISISVLVILFFIAYIGAKSAMKIQYFIMAIIAFSLIAFFLGTKADNTQLYFWGSSNDVSFWTVFAIFFPAVTGISAGASMSGDLKNPRRNLPIGILSAIGLGFIIYIGSAYWLAKQATHEELLNNTFIMKDIAIWGFAITAGVIGATLSSAIGCMLAAPRVLMALGEDRVLPLSKVWAERSSNGEPIYSLMLTTGIVLLSILLGDLNTIAPLLTMFFLITYGMINLSVFTEKLVGVTSFRPSFNIPLLIPFIGGIWCFIIMFLINSLFAGIAIIIIGIVYFIQLKRGLSAPWGDIRGAIFNMIAEEAAKTAAKMPQTAKGWKPNLLVPIENPRASTSIISFLKDIVFPKGTIRLFSVKVTNGNSYENAEQKTKEQLLDELNELASTARKDGIFTSTSVIEGNHFLEVINIITQVTRGMYFSPNIIFLTMSSDRSKSSILEQMIQISIKQKLGIIILGLHPKTSFGRKEIVNLWLRDKSPNQNLAVLMAVELQQQWGQVRLLRVTNSEENINKELNDLKRIVEEDRMPARTELTVLVGSFEEAMSKAPLADLNIFGMSDQMTIDNLYHIADKIDTSCLFAMDSGTECTAS